MCHVRVTWLLAHSTLRAFYSQMLPYLHHDFTRPGSIWTPNRYLDVVFQTKHKDMTAILLHRQGAVYTMLQHTNDGFSLMPYVLVQELLRTDADLQQISVLREPQPYTTLGSIAKDSIMKLPYTTTTDPHMNAFLQEASRLVQTDDGIPLGIASRDVI